MVGPGQVL